MKGTNMLAIGIDWATRFHVAVFMTKPGEVLARITFDNTYEGYLHLLDRIRAYAYELKTDEVAFAIESKDLRLVDFLLANSFTGYLVDPNRMEGYRLRYCSSGAKSDDRDGFVLADVLLKDRDQLTPIRTASDAIQRLKMLLADRAGFVTDQVVLTGRLGTCLREYYPAALELFASVTGSTILAFLEAYPTLEQTKNLDDQTLSDFLKVHHAFSRKRMQRMLDALVKPAIPVPAVIVEVKHKTALGLVAQLQVVRKIIDRCDADIHAALAENPETKRFNGLPGAGPIISGTLYVLFGDDRTRFANAHEVQSYVGTAPRTIQSGESRMVGFRFRCHRDYRAVITRWAFSSLRRAQWTKCYYNQKRREGKTHYHALRCLANILLKIAFTIWKRQTEYDENQYLAQIARHRMNNEA
jgi:transposase